MSHPIARFRPWTYQAHLTFQHIPELWQFSQTELREDSRIPVQVFRIAINVQPVHPEPRSIFSAAKFFSESLLLRSVERSCRQYQQRSPEDEQHEPAADIHAALHSYAHVQ